MAEAASQSPSSDKTPRAHGYSIGICATEEAATLRELLETIGKERAYADLVLRKIIVVASGCSPSALKTLKDKAMADDRLSLIVEPLRRGKAAAINEIIRKSVGEFLVLVNADARPGDGSISELLRVITSDDKAGIVSAAPYFEPQGGIVSDLLELMWTVHNDWSLTMNHAGINNHASDELMVVNAKALEILPAGLVNDGAFIAGTAFLKGYSIRFSKKARVKIQVPHRLIDVIRQRRRIVFGHFQVWRWLGQSPRTVELMLWSAPILTLGLLVRRITESPKLIRTVPLAAFSEVVALLLAIKDILSETGQHTVWKRFQT